MQDPVSTSPTSDKRRILYDALSSKYNLGPFEDFSQKLDDPAKRKVLYDAVSQTHNLGDFQTFETKVSRPTSPSMSSMSTSSQGGEVPTYENIPPKGYVPQPEERPSFGRSAMKALQGLATGAEAMQGLPENFGPTGARMMGAAAGGIQEMGKGFGEVLGAGRDITHGMPVVPAAVKGVTGALRATQGAVGVAAAPMAAIPEQISGPVDKVLDWAVENQPQFKQYSPLLSPEQREVAKGVAKLGLYTALAAAGGATLKALGTIKGKIEANRALDTGEKNILTQNGIVPPEPTTAKAPPTTVAETEPIQEGTIIPAPGTELPAVGEAPKPDLAKSIIEKAGAQYVGQQGNLVLFNDPQTKSTLTLKAEEVTGERVAQKMVESRAKNWKKAEQAPEAPVPGPVVPAPEAISPKPGETTPSGKVARPGASVKQPPEAEPHRMSNMPEEIQSTVRDEAQGLINEVKGIETSPGGLIREEGTEGKPGAGKVTGRYGAASTAGEWFKELKRSKDDVLKNLEKIRDDDPTNTFALKLIDKIVEMKKNGRFEKGYELIPGDEEFAGMFDAYLRGEYGKGTTEFPFGANEPKPTNLFGEQTPEAKKKVAPAPQEELLTPEQKGQAKIPATPQTSNIPLSEQVKGTMFEPTGEKGPELPFAMGAASLKEFLPEKQFVTSIKNATVDAERETRGLPPAMQAAQRSFGTVWDETMRKVEENQNASTELVEELKKKPRALTDSEDALLLHRQIELQNDYEKAVNRLNEAREQGDDATAEEYRARTAQLSDDLLDIYNVGKTSGTETGRGLNARRMLAKEDFSLAKMTTEKRAANGGKPLTPGQTADIQRLNNKINELQKQVDDYELSRQKLVSEEQSRQAHKRFAADVIAEDVASKQAGEQRDLGVEHDAIIAGLKRASAEGKPLEDLSNYIQKLAKNFIRQGIRERDPLINAVHGVLTKEISPDITRRETMDAISGYGNYKELSKDEISVQLRGLKGEMQQVAKLEDIIDKREAPLKTGVERRTPTDEERRLIQQVNEAKRRYGIQTVDSARQLKSALDGVKSRLKNQIADLEYQIATGKKIVKDKSGVAYDEEAEQLKARRDALKFQYDEIFGKPWMTDEQRINIATGSLEKSIAEYERRVREKDLSARTQISRTPVTPELEALRARRDAIKEEYKQLQDIANPKKTPEQIALQSLKTRLINRTAELQDKLSRGDFSTRTRRKVGLDQEGMRLMADAERAKQEYRRGLTLDRLRRRNLWEKTQDTFVKWRRGFILSGPVTLAKLTSAAIERMVFTPTEEAIGSGIAKIIPSIAAKTMREGGLNVQAEAKAITQAFTKGMTDAWQTLQTGHSDLDMLYGKQNGLPRSVIEFFGNIHGALKAPVKRNEFARSFEKRVASAMKVGTDVSDPMVQTRIAVDAYKDANRSIFLQENRVVSAYQRALSVLEERNKATGKPSAAGKALATTARVLLPIVKVPANIVAETLQYGTGLVTGSARLANAFRRGVETLQPEEADLIMRHLQKGSMGGAALLLGYLGANSIGGYYQPGKRDPRDVKFASVRVFGHDIPSYLIHNPLLECLQIGATARRVSESLVKKTLPHEQGISTGLVAGGLGLIEEVPFVREMMEVGKAFNPTDRVAFFGELGKSLLVPQLVQWAATQTDKTQAGQVRKRKPVTMMEHIESAIPGLRKKVPIEIPAELLRGKKGAQLRILRELTNEEVGDVRHIPASTGR